MPKIQPPEIIPVYCDECGSYLIGAPANTLTYCPACNTWSKATKKDNNNQQGVDKFGNNNE
jgi:uncharacterized Zn finger protein (UPF0148 family)